MVLVRVALVLLALVGTARAEQPLLVVAGGYGSCPWFGDPDEMKMMPPVEKLLFEELPEGDSLKLVRVCGALSRTAVYVDVHEVHGTSTSVDYTEESDQSMRRSDVPAYLAGLREDLGEGPTIFVGQSYGAWTLMRAALWIPRVDVLATIDPISALQCKIGSVLWSLVTGGRPECTRFPDDLVPYVNAIRLATYQWLHFYQTDYARLHSGTRIEADSNIHLAYPDSSGPFGAHADTETDPRIWNAIAVAFRGAMP